MDMVTRGHRDWIPVGLSSVGIFQTKLVFHSAACYLYLLQLY